MGWLTSYSGDFNIEPPISMKASKEVNAFGRNTPGGPGSDCDFKINEDGEIEHDGSEKESDTGPWLAFIVRHLAAMGYTVNGQIEETWDEDGGGQNIYVAENNVVSLQEYELVITGKRTVL